MDAIAILQEISKKQSIDGTVEEAMAKAQEALGSEFNELSSLLLAQTKGGSKEMENVCSHILGAGGKSIRAAVCLMCYQAASGKAPLPLDLAVCCELLHSATLLHDDVIDEGELRRGRPAARVVYGNALSILGGDFLLTKSVGIVSQRGSLFLDKFIETLNELIEGEVVQLKYRNSIDIREEDYFKIVEGKTASLFGWSAWAGATAALGAHESCELFAEFGRNLGIAFQLIDDLLDYTADEDTLGKNLLADIGQGKFTLPAIYAVESSKPLRDLIQGLIVEPGSHGAMVEVAKKISQSGAVQRVKERAASHNLRACEALAKIDGDNDILNLLSQLSKSLLVRNK